MPIAPTPSTSWARGSLSANCGTSTKPSPESPCRRTPSVEPWNPTYEEPEPFPPALSAAPHNDSAAHDRYIRGELSLGGSAKQRVRLLTCLQVLVHDVLRETPPLRHRYALISCPSPDSREIHVGR